MFTTSDVSLELMHELGVTLCKAGWGLQEFTTLARSEERCRQALTILRGQIEVKVIDHIIDLDAKPFIPERWRVRKIVQLRGSVIGQFKYDPTKVKLHLSKNQQDGRVIKGRELRKELETQPVLNANLLDFYLDHPDLIPEEWKGKLVFFWGTIYRNPLGHLCIRCLYWDGGRWIGYYRLLVNDWYSNHPAALLDYSTP